MAVSIDQQFVEYIVKSLVGKPDAVKVDRRIDEKGVLLELTVDPEDLGRVIGKRGSTAQSLRTLLRALGTKNDARYNLKIVDTGPPPNRDRVDSRQETVDRAEKKPEKEVITAVADEPTYQPPKAADDIDVSEDEDLEKIEAKTKDTSDVISRTRKELEELDDLDV
ncbi:MAG TPA: KH domain-containing protein [Candidatus Saccharimonadales bacterium]